MSDKVMSIRVTLTEVDVIIEVFTSYVMITIPAWKQVPIFFQKDYFTLEDFAQSFLDRINTANNLFWYKAWANLDADHISRLSLYFSDVR